MPRRRVVAKRLCLPDPKYHSAILAKFINAVMVTGKKSVAESIVYGALAIVKQKMPKDSEVKVFEQALDNAKPLLQVKSRRVGGATYQVPIELSPGVRTALASRWMIEFARKRSEKTMKERLAGEIMDCYGNQGSTVRRKEETHRMAEANKAFAHFRF